MLRGWNPSNTPGVQRETNGDRESEEDRRRDWEVCEQWMSAFERLCVCLCASTFSCTPSTPLRTSACRSCLSGCTLSKSVCEPVGVCVCVSCCGGGGRGCKDIKKERKPFFFPFVCECGGASFSALSYGHKDDSDNPFISLTSCRLREDRWLLPRLFMALLIPHSRSWSSSSLSPLLPFRAIPHPAASFSFSHPCICLCVVISKIW